MKIRILCGIFVVLSFLVPSHRGLAQTELPCASVMMEMNGEGEVWLNNRPVTPQNFVITEIEYLPTGSLKVLANGYLLVSTPTISQPQMPPVFYMPVDTYQFVAADPVIQPNGMIAEWLIVLPGDESVIYQYQTGQPVYWGVSPIVDFDVVTRPESHDWLLVVLDETGLVSTIKMEYRKAEDGWSDGYVATIELKLEADVWELTTVDETGNWIQLTPGHPLFDDSRVHGTQITTAWVKTDTGVAYPETGPVFYVSEGFYLNRLWQGVNQRSADFIHSYVAWSLAQYGVFPISGCALPYFLTNTELA